MTKSKLKSTAFAGAEVLSRTALKNVMGRKGGTGGPCNYEESSEVFAHGLYSTDSNKKYVCNGHTSSVVHSIS